MLRVKDRRLSLREHVYMRKTFDTLQSLEVRHQNPSSRFAAQRRKGRIPYRRIDKPRGLPNIFGPPLRNVCLNLKSSRFRSILFFLCASGTDNNFVQGDTPFRETADCLRKKRRRRRVFGAACKPAYSVLLESFRYLFSHFCRQACSYMRRNEVWRRENR